MPLQARGVGNYGGKLTVRGMEEQEVDRMLARRGRVEGILGTWTDGCGCTVEEDVEKSVVDTSADTRAKTAVV